MPPKTEPADDDGMISLPAVLSIYLIFVTVMLVVCLLIIHP